MARMNQSPKEKSMIETCVLRSKFIIASKAFKHQLKVEASFFHKRMSSLLPSAGYLNTLCDEADEQILDHEKSIARYLRPVFETARLEPREKYSFSYNDLKRGYVEISTSNNFIVTHILLLGKVTDVIDGTIYDAGTIQTFDKISHLLEDVTSLVKADTVMIQHAVRKLKL